VALWASGSILGPSGASTRAISGSITTQNCLCRSSRRGKEGSRIALLAAAPRQMIQAGRNKDRAACKKELQRSTSRLVGVLLPPLSVGLHRTALRIVYSVVLMESRDSLKDFLPRPTSVVLG